MAPEVCAPTRMYSKANVFTEIWDKDFYTHSMRRLVRPYLRVGFLLSVCLSYAELWVDIQTSINETLRASLLSGRLSSVCLSMWWNVLGRLGAARVRS